MDLLRAALVEQPASESQPYMQTVCSEKLMLCMRADDPFSSQEVIARNVFEERLRIMFARDLHPPLYNRIERKLAKANIRLRPREWWWNCRTARKRRLLRCCSLLRQ